MNPGQQYGTITTQLTSTGTSDVKTWDPPEGTRGVLLSVKTNDCYITFDSSTPSSSNGHDLPKAALPLYLPIGRKSRISIASSAAGNSTLDITGFAA